MAKSGFSRDNRPNASQQTFDSRTNLQYRMENLKLTNDERKIKLITNYYPIDIRAAIIYHYDIDIYKIHVLENDDTTVAEKYHHKKYKCLNTRNKRNVVETMVDTKLQGFRPAFDGEKNLYTSKPLPENLGVSFNIIIDENGRSVTYEVNLKPVNKEDNVGSLPKNSISLEPLHQLLEGNYSDITEIQIAVMAIETIIRHGPAQRLIPIGRSFYAKPREDVRRYISGGLEMWFGHYQCVQITERGLMLNIDCSAKPFYKSCSVIDFILDILYPDSKDKGETLRQIRRLSEAQQDTLIKKLKNVNIQVTHLKYKRKYRISSITPNSANKTFFERDIDGEKTISSIANYFRSTYEELKYPNLPCLDVSTRFNTCYLPMEVCEIVEGQHYNRKLSEKQIAEMSQFTAQPPTKRFKEIENSLKVVLQDFDIFSREFGIHINPYPVRLVGKVLNPPVITYSEDEVQPSNGRWNMRGQQFLEGVNVGKWMILNFSPSPKCNRTTLENFARMLIKEGSNVGLKFSPQPIIKTVSCNDAPGDIIKREKETQPDLQLIVIVLPSNSQNIYREIKTVAETDLGIRTQCIKDITISGKKFSSQLICNICQKINAKMGGINYLLLEENLEDIMIIGADCCHPSPGEDNEYSIAALVGNLDNFSGKYKASVSAQKPSIVNGINSGREIIIDIKEMMKELLFDYRENSNGMIPEKIIFYRDGVSEGDFVKLLDYELSQIRDAIEEEYKIDGNEIPITFIVVRKRHHTRFNVMNPSDGVYANVPPGTVVDNHIVYPFFDDFFLCSPVGIKGTSQPAHYTVINDDSNFCLDEIQTLTYNLCHTSVRSTTSISVPSSVLYADLAAARAMDYLKCKSIEMSTSDDAQQQVIIEESIKEAINVDEIIENSMYFI